MSNIKLDVRAYPLAEPKGSTVSFASASINDMVAIRGIRVVESEKGKFVAMPQSQDKNGDYHDIAFPLDGELRKELNAAVLEEHEKMASLAPEQRGYANPDKSAMQDINADEINLSVKVYPLSDPKGSTVAFVNVGIADLVAINSIRIVNSDSGMFVAMPQSKDKDENYHDIAFPVNGALRKAVSKAVLTEYDKAIGKEKSVGARLNDGAEKVAKHTAPPGDVAAKGAPGLGD